jgi:calcineurin-like phosphoesterase family protein
MSKVYFIADTHFQHKNILKYEGLLRPFKDLEEHDNEIVKRWNGKVGPMDKVYVLGDFSFGDVSIAGKLNGTKVLVLGNHDYEPTEEYLKYFKKVYAAVNYKGYLLTHIPIHDSQKRKYLGNIHGHLHSRCLEDPFYINCSIERLPNLEPIEFTELISFNA